MSLITTFDYYIGRECSLCHNTLAEASESHLWQGHYYDSVDKIYDISTVRAHVFHAWCLRNFFQQTQTNHSYCPKCSVTLTPQKNFIEAILQRDREAVARLLPNPSVNLLERYVSTTWITTSEFNLETARFLLSLAEGADLSLFLIQQISMKLVRGNLQDFEQFLSSFPKSQNNQLLQECLETAVLNHTNLNTAKFLLQKKPEVTLEKERLLEKACYNDSHEMVGLILTHFSFKEDKIIEVIKNLITHNLPFQGKMQEILSYCRRTLQLEEQALKEFAEKLIEAIVLRRARFGEIDLEPFIPIFGSYKQDFLFLAARIGTVDFIQKFFRFQQKEQRTA